MARKFIIVGGSNSINIQDRRNKHPSFKNYQIENISFSGATVSQKHPKSMMPHIRTPDQEKILVLFLNSNGFQDARRFIQGYMTFLTQLLTFGWKNDQLILLLPLVRGNNYRRIYQQLDQFDRLQRFSKKKGIHVVSTWDEIPRNWRWIDNLFGQKSIQKGEFTHYSAKIRGIIHKVIGKEMRNYEKRHPNVTLRLKSQEENILNLKDIIFHQETYRLNDDKSATCSVISDDFAICQHCKGVHIDDECKNNTDCNEINTVISDLCEISID